LLYCGYCLRVQVQQASHTAVTTTTTVPNRLESIVKTANDDDDDSDNDSDNDSDISTLSAKHDSVSGSSLSNTESADVQQVDNSVTAAAAANIDTNSDPNRTDASNTSDINNKEPAAATEVTTNACLYTT
jgi:hypothetical protein